MENLKFVVYKNKKYWVSGNGKYFYYCLYKKDGKCKKRIALHRQVWMDANDKQISDGYDIHHKDGNVFNNESDNLECIKESDHHAEHMRARWAKNRKENYANLLRAIEKSKQWHFSDEGREWHREQGKKSWIRREKKVFLCKGCGKEYKAFRAGFCSNNCCQKFYYKTKKYHEERICILCGKKFSVRKIESTRTCSHSCAAKMRWNSRVLFNT